MNNITKNIDNIINIFSSDNISNILEYLNIDNYYEAKQIHSDIIQIVDENYIEPTEGDALITNIPNKPLIIKIADCIPILLYDKENKVLALVHSGWLGTLKDITTKTVNKMITVYNTNPSNIISCIYPSIRKCHFEVEYDVYSKFKEEIENIDKYTNKKGSKYYIDMQSIIKDKLINLGITNIIDTSICTYCNNDKYYSYRYNHTDKRNILLAMIKE